MWTTALARPHRRTTGAGRSLTGSLPRNTRARALEDRFSSLRHNRSWRSRPDRPLRCRVHRTWPRLRNDQPARRRRRTRSRRFGDGWRRSRRSRNSTCRVTRNLRCRLHQRHRRLNRRRGGFGNGLKRAGRRRFDHCLWSFGRRFLDWRSRNRSLRWCGRFRRNNYSRWRTHNSLGSDQAWSRLWHLNRCNGRSAGSNRRRLCHCAGRTRRHSGGGSYRLTGRHCRHGWTRRSCGLSSLLCDRLEHVTGPGYVREVDLRLELVGRRARAAARRRRSTGLTVLRVELLDALRLIHFDGTGVRLLFRDSNLWKDLEYHFGFDLEFPRQVVNSNLLLHSALLPP
jgi:hypothetical protein